MTPREHEVPCQVYQANESYKYYIYLDHSQRFAHEQEMTIEYENPPIESYQTMVSQETYDKLLETGYLEVPTKPNAL